MAREARDGESFIEGTVLSFFALKGECQALICSNLWVFIGCHSSIIFIFSKIITESGQKSLTDGHYHGK